MKKTQFDGVVDAVIFEKGNGSILSHSVFDAPLAL